ncbi:unnamed protein product [Phytophthora lilii]|uniref:Unnamed protein product n=1 Tax=Phytophthora lilii TaxID=2077276 RepID=A0A9W6U8N1_9STRA|nr:unnamed protein product [Phytophthora lilii]
MRAPSWGMLLIAMMLLLPIACAVTEMDDLLLDSNGTAPGEPPELPSGRGAPRRFRCVGWRATGDCTPDGPREPQNDKSCDEVITSGSSGFCEIEDVNSGEHFKAMYSHCSGLLPKTFFRCSESPNFANFQLGVHAVVQKAQVPGFSLSNAVGHNQAPRDGIVMVVYPQVLASAYASIRVLRDVLKCRLPIEIWFHVDEIGDDLAQLAPLQKLAIFVGRVSFRPMYNPRAKGFASRIFSIYHSQFARVLFLDADNVPVRDPSFLFASNEFEANGAVFWPDFWHPRHTLSNVHEKSMLWELLHMPFVDMFEQESGQLLVDRTRHAAPLELVYFYAFHEPNYFQKLNLVQGDKDLFRLAWMKLKAPFHMIETVPSIAGRAVEDSFCGMTMVQHDADGEVLFMHRNQYKLTGEHDERLKTEVAEESTSGSDSGSMAAPPPEQHLGAPQPDQYPDAIIWTHLLSFPRNTSIELYRVDAYRAVPLFPAWQPCYDHRDVSSLEHFEMHEISGMSFGGLESDLRHYAQEARQR